MTGVQLSKLSDAGKDQLALLVAQRKVVAFRDQDLADLPIQEALDFGGYFGRHHIHPVRNSVPSYNVYVANTITRPDKRCSRRIPRDPSRLP